MRRRGRPPVRGPPANRSPLVPLLAVPEAGSIPVAGPGMVPRAVPEPVPGSALGMVPEPVPVAQAVLILVSISSRQAVEGGIPVPLADPIPGLVAGPGAVVEPVPVPLAELVAGPIPLLNERSLAVADLHSLVGPQVPD